MRDEVAGDQWDREQRREDVYLQRTDAHQGAEAGHLLEHTGQGGHRQQDGEGDSGPAPGVLRSGQPAPRDGPLPGYEQHQRHPAAACAAVSTVVAGAVPTA